MKKTQLVKLVKEGMSNHLSMIDEAGTIAANEAKLSKMASYIDEGNKIGKVFDNKLFDKFLSSQTLKTVKKELSKGISQIQKQYDKLQTAQLKLTTSSKK